SRYVSETFAARTRSSGEDGTKVKNARMTVRHNGVVIHDDIEIARMTPGGVRTAEGTTGPLFLQDHGNPVRYRSIWVLPSKDTGTIPHAADAPTR
ncbi:MAG: family 16 glycoside hydrolase, partial [Gemmatimonadota bacterium]